MPAVADTSPINYLVLIGQIEILPKIYGQVLIPQAVRDELQDSEAPAEIRAWLSAPPEWLRTSRISDPQEPRLDHLDRGEREAIFLAESVHADRLIIDDLDARREAVARGLPVIGTLGILAEAARRRLLDLDHAVAALRATSFHVAPTLLKRLLADHRSGNQ